MKIDQENYQKILFRLKKDADDYPPDDWESLWASETGLNLYSIDNIPFFVRGVSLNDTVSAEERDGELHFKRVENFSDHSVVVN